MASTIENTKRAVVALKSIQNTDDLIDRIRHQQEPTPTPTPLEHAHSLEGVEKRRAFLRKISNQQLDYLTPSTSPENLNQLEGNIENFIGLTQIPTGVIGRLRIIGSAAKGDFYIPLATSEGALVASYHRGAKACLLSGGATSICLIEGVQRSPLFKFDNIADLGSFLIWVLDRLEKFREITAQTSRFARLLEMKTNIEGNHLILTFEYSTGDAAGQNMVTICTDVICKYMIEHAPVKPLMWFIEGNYSGDKKATLLSFTNVRGKKVTTEIRLSSEVIQNVLKTSPEAMAEYWRSSTIGAIQSGAIGAQGHYANGLAALFLATGQDVACISEAAVGITRMELTDCGGLYVSVTLPNLMIGTVGGGTSLPTQKECLQLMDCYGPGKAKKLAEICGALVLAGEISIAAALSAGHFSEAHQKFGRKK
ncbi:hydroxymethylglutaryl-CoA reductase [Dyadobacter sp. 32]|uniref:hydroxymethylglutaryl-CoA reductase n=1 Tax=Dyadobacter sp. 32 TaxID=538966 RepID=UPI0011F0260B